MLKSGVVLGRDQRDIRILVPTTLPDAANIPTHSDDQS